MIITHFKPKKHARGDILHINVTSSSFLDIVEQFQSYKQNVKDVLIDVCIIPMHLRLGIHMDIKHLSFHPSYGLAEGFLSCIEVINKLL